MWAAVATLPLTFDPRVKEPHSIFELIHSSNYVGCENNNFLWIFLVNNGHALLSLLAALLESHFSPVCNCFYWNVNPFHFIMNYIRFFPCRSTIKSNTHAIDTTIHRPSSHIRIRPHRPTWNAIFSAARIPFGDDQPIPMWTCEAEYATPTLYLAHLSPSIGPKIVLLRSPFELCRWTGCAHTRTTKTMNNELLEH